MSRRYNNAANRCYYATFQAAVAALQRTGIQPRTGEWSHAFVPAQFDGLLINRHKVYPPDLRGVLARNFGLRQIADYGEASVSRTDAAGALNRTRTFVQAVEDRGGGSR